MTSALLLLLACGEPSVADMEDSKLEIECITSGSVEHCQEAARRHFSKGNKSEAARYYRQACTKVGHEPACYLAAINYSMSPLVTDHDRADEMLAAGCKLGDQKQCSGPKVDEIRARRTARGF